MIEIKNLSKTFESRHNDNSSTVEALRDVNITIEDGDIFGIIGMSGAGKSTLVRCINMLERPTLGTVIIDGVDMAKLSDKELREARRGITMIFQGFNLLMQKTCLKNICFPLELGGMKKDEAEARARQLLDIVGLPDKAYSYPAQLSGGQQQRIAIARALATSPKVLLCDEATSALDPATTAQILELIKDINRKTGITVVIITHQMSVVESVCSHVAILDGGCVAETGDVSEVFAHPRSAAGRRLVCPEGSDASSPIISDPSQKFLRIVFNGKASANSPLIADMAIDTGVRANIAAASTKMLGDKAYASLVLGVKDEKELTTALEYLNGKPGVSAEAEEYGEAARKALSDAGEAESEAASGAVSE